MIRTTLDISLLLTSLKFRSTASARMITATMITAGDAVVDATKAIGVTEGKVVVAVDAVVPAATLMETNEAKVAETTITTVAVACLSLIPRL